MTKTIPGIAATAYNTHASQKSTLSWQMQAANWIGLLRVVFTIMRV
ncbi:hypothetical protein [Levilactobacillus brevis]|nr:hypothetical protein [Levilactobacillus brevis]